GGRRNTFSTSSSASAKSRLYSKAKATSSISSPNCFRALVRSRTPARVDTPCAARCFVTSRPIVPVAPVTKVFFAIPLLSRESIVAAKRAGAMRRVLPRLLGPEQRNERFAISPEQKEEERRNHEPG